MILCLRDITLIEYWKQHNLLTNIVSGRGIGALMVKAVNFCLQHYWRLFELKYQHLRLRLPDWRIQRSSVSTFLTFFVW